jgi:hypothetical protein
METQQTCHHPNRRFEKRNSLYATGGLPRNDQTLGRQEDMIEGRTKDAAVLGNRAAWEITAQARLTAHILDNPGTLFSTSNQLTRIRNGSD